MPSPSSYLSSLPWPSKDWHSLFPLPAFFTGADCSIEAHQIRWCWRLLQKSTWYFHGTWAIRDDSSFVATMRKSQVPTWSPTMRVAQTKQENKGVQQFYHVMHMNMASLFWNQWPQMPQRPVACLWVQEAPSPTGSPSHRQLWRNWSLKWSKLIKISKNLSEAHMKPSCWWCLAWRTERMHMSRCLELFPTALQIHTLWSRHWRSEGQVRLETLPWLSWGWHLSDFILTTHLILTPNTPNEVKLCQTCCEWRPCMRLCCYSYPFHCC